MAASSFSFQWKVHGRADQKNAISRNFWHFSSFDVFFERGTQGHPKTQAGPPKQLWYLRYGRRKFKFHWKNMREGRTKIVIFSNLDFQTP